MLGKAAAPGVHHRQGVKTQAALPDHLGQVLLAHLDVGVVQPVGDQHHAAQALAVLGLESGVGHIGDESVEVGEPGGIDAGPRDGLGPCFLGGQRIADGQLLSHAVKHQGINGPQSVIERREGPKLLLLLGVAEGAGLVHHAVIGDGQLRLPNGGDGAGDTLTLGCYGNGPALHRLRGQVQGIPFHPDHGMQEACLLLRAGGKGQAKQQCQAQKKGKDSFHGVHLISMSLRWFPS